MKKSKTPASDTPSADRQPDQPADRTAEPASDNTTIEPAEFDELIDRPDAENQKLSEIESTEVAPTDDTEASADPDQEVVIKKPAVRRPWWKRPKIIIPIAAGVILIATLLAIPVTRFALLGWAWRENVALTIVDSTSGAPVADAMVSLAGRQLLSDNHGRVTVGAVPIGNYMLRVEKPNYQTIDTSLVVDVFSSGQQRQQTIAATGRPVTVRVVDRLTSKPVADATITDGKQAKLGRTDGDGRAVVVIPINKKELDVSVAAGNYRVLAAKITGDTTTLQLVPDGALYFLSKQSGKIDVVRTNLDGSDRKVVVAGTGDENDQTTTLLASRDWKYLVLKAKRAPNKTESLFIINTATDTMKLLDEGAVAFNLIGWSGHRFMYEVVRPDGGQYWRAKITAIKSFDADKSALQTLDENANDPASNATEAMYEDPSNYYILDDTLVYSKAWQHVGMTANLSEAGKTASIISVKPDGSARKTVKTFDLATANVIDAKLYSPQEVYFQITAKKPPYKQIYGEFENGAYKDVATINDYGEKTYPTFLMSPSGNASFWYEERDGKNAIFIGDKNADNKQELAARSEFKPYGWLTDGYLLLQKKDSELYITTKEQLKAGAEPLKVSDYHKLRAAITGYGYGYGGQ